MEERSGVCVSMGAKGSSQERQEDCWWRRIEYCSEAVGSQNYRGSGGATIEHSDPDDSFPVGAGLVEELGRLRGVLGVAD